MSALPPKADMRQRAQADVRFVPEAGIASSDYLVGTLQRRRHLRRQHRRAGWLSPIDSAVGGVPSFTL